MSDSLCELQFLSTWQPVLTRILSFLACGICMTTILLLGRERPGVWVGGYRMPAWGRVALHKFSKSSPVVYMRI